ncbi:MAG: ABC transporter ATP-binding protein [Candidatus Ancillula sp.]|jgi:putative ABC transport system ATP-binding protein|nr:ABC transporter ATP-binding protein [Candidatus Ancillula sp.]
MAILELQNVGYSYSGNVKNAKKVLSGLNYEFDKGVVYSITGRSGAGKTTLLSLLSGLTTPTEGKVMFDEKDLSTLDRYDYRSQQVGVVFQQFNLLPHLTVLENIILSMDASKKKFDRPKKEIALEMLNEVDLDESYANKRILKLSGGEQQRVAIARTLSFDPEVILADEPTGNLDLTTQDEIMSIFTKLAHEENRCVIIVTHSPEVAKLSDKVFNLAPLKKGAKVR